MAAIHNLSFSRSGWFYVYICLHYGKIQSVNDESYQQPWGADSFFKLMLVAVIDVYIKIPNPSSWTLHGRIYEHIKYNFVLLFVKNSESFKIFYHPKEVYTVKLNKLHISFLSLLCTN